MTYLKNFMKLFGIYNEDVFINSLNQAKMQGSLGISYINAIIKLSQKKNTVARIHKNLQNYFFTQC